MRKPGRPHGSVDPNSRRSRLLEHLKAGEPIMQPKAKELFGIKSLYHYIESLRDRGYEFELSWIYRPLQNRVRCYRLKTNA